MNNFLPQNYQTENEDIELEEAKIQNWLEYLKELQIKSLENVK